MFARKALIKIALQGKDDVFLLSEYEPEKKLTLKLLNIQRNESYIGQASNLDLRTQAARIRLTFSDFLTQAEQALFQVPQNECSYIYELVKENELYTFKWKSVDGEETVISLGCVQVSKQNHVIVLTDILLSLSKELFELNLKVKNISSDLTKCKNQTSSALSQLSEAVSVKEDLEMEMYTKFLLVLNEKKRRIKKFKNERDSKLHSTTGNDKASKSGFKRSKLSALSSSSDEEVDGFLDLNRPGPSSSVKRNSLLFLGDDDESVVPVKPNKVRNRKTGSKISSYIPTDNTTEKSKPNTIFDDDSDEFLIGNL